MEEKRLNESRFLWGTLAIILILPLLGLLNSGNTGGSTLSGATVIVPEQAIQTISTASAGSELFFEIKVGGVKDLTLKFREDVRDMKLVISSPVSTGWFEGKSYSTFEVSSESTISMVRHCCRGTNSGFFLPTPQSSCSFFSSSQRSQPMSPEVPVITIFILV